MRNILISAVLALASAALAVSDLQTCLMLGCAAFWAGLARKEWRERQSARESENMEKRRQLRRRLLGGSV